MPPLSFTCQQPGPPIVGGTTASICRGETSALTATGCLGTVIWSTGEQGTAIRVTPYQTTRYTAVCRLADGCVSCFAEAYTVTVNAPPAPLIATTTPVICPGDSALLTVGNCPGRVSWATGHTGTTLTVRPVQTTVYEATCQQAECRSAPTPLTLRITTPVIPELSLVSDGRALCAGQTVQLAASECAGQVRWSDGAFGANRILMLSQNISLRAVCRVGSCQSDSSGALVLRVDPSVPTVLQYTTVQNGCPYQTADLITAIGSAFRPDYTYLFKTNPAPDSPSVGSPGAVLAGVYFISSKTAAGCHTRPTAVSAVVGPCANAIAPCLSNPPVVRLQLDSLDLKRGVVCLKAQLRGTATDGLRLDSAWTCSGTGLFTDKTTMKPRYVASEADRQAPNVTFALATPDPDGSGPCLPGAASLAVGLAILPPGTTPDSTAIVVLPNVPEADGVFIPEGFSPNNDGINDRFVIQGAPAGATVDLAVFNRWGQRVFADGSYKNDWEGQTNQGIRTASGPGLPDGTYFYVVRISDGREYVRFLTIAR